MEVQLFPNSQLGGDTDMLSQLRTGAIQMFNLSGLILATYVPVAAINGIGFAFKDYDQVWTAMDGPLGAYIRGVIGKAGLYAFDNMWDNGYRQVTSSTRPINAPEDLRGFKIRVPVSPLWTSMFKALGASPTSININEVYSALQTKIVEGQENPLSLIDLFKFYEVQKYVSLTNHMWDGFWTLANARAWAELPKDLQQIVARNINGAALREREDVRQLNDSMQGELTRRGMVFNQTDTEKFRATLRSAGFYADWKQKYGRGGVGGAGEAGRQPGLKPWPKRRRAGPFPPRSRRSRGRRVPARRRDSRASSGRSPGRRKFRPRRWWRWKSWCC